MKILLVLPATDRQRVANNNGHVPKRAMKRFSILPLTTVAALTPEHHDVEICDENVSVLDIEAEVDLVGLSLMTATAPRGREIARIFRARGITVVAGGYHPSLCPEDTLSHFDAIVQGDAEQAWPRLLRDLEAGKKLCPVYSNDSPCSLEGLPEPRRKLHGRTAHHYATVNAVQAGRGCRHSCTYCSVTAFHNHTYRTRPVDEVIAEIKKLPRDFIFVDDNIVAEPDYARRLFTALVPLKKRWVSQCSLALADDPELLALARRAGCRGLFIGIETIDKCNLQSVGKTFNDESSYRARITAIQRAGIGIVAGMIVGMDHDRVTVFENSLAFLQRHHIQCIQLNIMTPLPGTPLHKEMQRQGRILDHDQSHYNFRRCVIRPALMSQNELQDGADWLYHQFYRLDRVLLRTLWTAFHIGFVPAVLTWKLNRTYRYDNRRERIIGRNPALRPKPSWAHRLKRWLAAPYPIIRIDHSNS